ncbi:hypothetical protein AB2L28_11445 [Kineococcus sp. TBRC 1896]|uniref:Secreted protein n=1 Tax=Kineococcus mangrovi TaxID=1660183 RepID=A0ABV4I5G6_9ACTN
MNRVRPDRPGARTRPAPLVLPALVLAALVLAGCGQPTDLAPPAAPEPVAPSSASTSSTLSTPSTPSSPSTPPATTPPGGPVEAVREHLRQQALAVNAGTADPAQVPAFAATLTPAARSWALPLLAANLGDRMPGPYPSGVLGQQPAGPDRVDLRLCLQDRGWQVEAATGTPVNAPHFGTATAVVVRGDGRWLVDDLTADGGTCSADDVTVERF